MHSYSTKSAFSPEIKFLCACSRVNPRGEDLKLQAALLPLVDVDVLFALTKRHRVDPLIYHNLKLHALGVVPADLLTKLAARVSRNTIGSLRALRINIQLSLLMREHDIDFLPLKGVTLAQRYYGEIGLRHTNDIDFWVPEHSVDKVRALLIAQGCKPCAEHDVQDIEARGTRHLKFLRHHAHHDVLIHPSGDSLEMHWRLASNVKGLTLDPVELLKIGESVNAGGECIMVIDPVSLLLYLCDHGGRHGWYRFKWLADLPQLLESRVWDWDLVLAKAKEANCYFALLLGLKLAQQLFDWVIPDVVLRVIPQRYLLNWQVRMVCNNLKKPALGSVDASVLQSVTHMLYRASIAENFGCLWNELVYYLLSPKDLEVVKLPDRLFIGYYALSPFILVWRKFFSRGHA